MAITNMDQLASLVSTSVAAYGELDKDDLKGSLIADEIGADFSDTQADNFIAEYSLLHHQENTLSGFSATLFEDSSGKKVLAIRGTEFSNINDLYADSNIATLGYAASQVDDLYRYWKQLTTPAGESVTYTTDELIKLYALENPVLSVFNPASISATVAFQEFTQNVLGLSETGLGLIDAFGSGNSEEINKAQEKIEKSTEGLNLSGKFAEMGTSIDPGIPRTVREAIGSVIDKGFKLIQDMELDKITSEENTIQDSKKKNRDKN